jgi:uncharacterized protein
MTLAPLTFADYPRLVSLFKDQRYRLCGYSLSSIIAWSNDNYQPLGAVVDDALIVAAEFNRKPEYRHLILPISPSRWFTPEALGELAERFGYDTYWFVCQEYMNRFDRARIEAVFRVEPQPDYDDYVYHAEDLAELRGNRYAKKRNLVKQFERGYVAPGRVSMAPLTSENADACAGFIEEWCAERDCDADPTEDLACEKQAVLNTLAHVDGIDDRGLVLRVDGDVCAMGMGTDLSHDMGVLHFEKAFSHYKGLYQYFDRECARRLFNGRSYINKESDMGVPGLAKAKKSYHPAMMARSCKMILK